MKLQMLCPGVISGKKVGRTASPTAAQSAPNRIQIEPGSMKLQMLCPSATFGKKVGRHPGPNCAPTGPSRDKPPKTMTRQAASC